MDNLERSKVQIQLPFKYLHFATQSSVIMCTMAATRMPLESQQKGRVGRVAEGGGGKEAWTGCDSERAVDYKERSSSSDSDSDGRSTQHSCR